MAGNRYQQTLDEYLEWRTGNFLRPQFVLGCAYPKRKHRTALHAMKEWESEGRALSEFSCEPEKLADYVQGKKSRDWHITEWKEGCRKGLFLAEEFIGTLGLSGQNFESIFGFPVRPRVLEITVQAELEAVNG